jgi:hypothetical protein
LSLPLSAHFLFAQEGGEPTEGKPAESEEAEFDPALKEKIRQLFVATKIEFEGSDRVILFYHFKKNDQHIAADFQPAIESIPKRMRWSRGYEGYYTLWEHGVVVNRLGIWLHKAVWDDDVEFDFEYGSLSEIMKPADLIAAIYSWNKGKRIVGSNRGEQCVYLSKALKHAKAPIPRSAPSLITNGQKRHIGFRIEDDVFSAQTAGRTRASADESSKFLKNRAPGQVGIAWNGQWVKGMISSVTIKGTLDKEWLEKALAELK